jgi:transposase
MTLSDIEKNIISRGRERGISWVDLGYILGKTASAVRMYSTRQRDRDELGEVPIARQRPSRAAAKRAIEHILTENPKTPYRALPAALSEAGINQDDLPSASTCRRIARELGFENVKARKRNFISTSNALKRLQFAQQYLAREESFFERIIWSDETMVRAAPQGKEMRFWTQKGRENNTELVNYQYQQGYLSVMFWGCFSSFGFGPLVVVDGSMDASKYIELITNYLLDENRVVREQAGVSMVIMQDNAPCHKAKVVMDFFADSGIELLPRSPQSPDLNPIENLWAIIKRKRQSPFGAVTSKNELIEQILTIWDGLDDQLAVTLASSASRRLSKCFTIDGRHTGY